MYLQQVAFRWAGVRVVTGQHLLNVPEFRAKPAYTLRYLGTLPPTSYMY